jgi:arginine/lysine/ornithine decarboxylase
METKRQSVTKQLEQYRTQSAERFSAQRHALAACALRPSNDAQTLAENALRVLVADAVLMVYTEALQALQRGETELSLIHTLLGKVLTYDFLIEEHTESTFARITAIEAVRTIIDLLQRWETV